MGVAGLSVVFLFCQEFFVMTVELQFPLVLASGSVRRSELLSAAGYEFDVVPPPIEEPSAGSGCSMTAGPWAEALAYFKARAVAASRPDAIVVGADTIVARNDDIIGKPADEADARRILSTLFVGESHVITGLAVLPPMPHERTITHVSSLLAMRPMEPDELEDYIAGGAWRGKAGAYALQEGGDRFAERIEGSRSNIVGLPMERLTEILTSFRR